MAAVVLGKHNLIQMLLGNYISFAFHMRFEIDPYLMNSIQEENVETENKSSLSAIMSDLLMCYCDLFTNDLNVIKSVYNILKPNSKTNRNTLRFDEFEEAIKKVMLDYAIVNCPCPGSKIYQVLSEAVLPDRATIAEFFNDCLERDQETRVCKVKDRLFQKTQLSTRDFLQHWSTTKHYDRFLEFFNIQSKDQFNTVNISLGSSKTSQQIAEQIDHASFFKGMGYISELVTKMGQWNSICQSFFRSVNLHVQLMSLRPETVTSEERDTFMAEVSTWVSVAKKHVDTEQQKPIDDFLHLLQQYSNGGFEGLKLSKFGSRNSDSNTMQEVMGEKTTGSTVSNQKFKDKSARILERIAKKKVQFFEGAAEETKKLVEQMTKESSSALTCSLTNNPINESAEYYLIVRVHMSNVNTV